MNPQTISTILFIESYIIFSILIFLAALIFSSIKETIRKAFIISSQQGLRALSNYLFCSFLGPASIPAMMYITLIIEDDIKQSSTSGN